MHAEWCACLNFMSANREFFKERNFKSKAFPKSDTLLDYVPKREREEAAKKIFAEEQKESGEGESPEKEEGKTA